MERIQVRENKSGFFNQDTITVFAKDMKYADYELINEMGYSTKKSNLIKIEEDGDKLPLDLEKIKNADVFVIRAYPKFSAFVYYTVKK